MAFFIFKDIKKSSHKKGVWLRIDAILKNKYFLAALKEVGFPLNKAPHLIQRIVVKEIDKNNRVLLQIWCQNPKQYIVSHKRLVKYLKDFEENKCFHDPPYRPIEEFTVFYILAKEDPEWICESDIGRGYVAGKIKKGKRNGS